MAVLNACSGGSSSAYEWDLPPNFPRPAVPDNNPMTDEKVELGRHLFYDPRLSGNETQSCASCHRQELAFTDGRALAIGSTGELHPRSSMSLGNVAYSGTLTWMSPLLVHLEEQALVPMFGEDPVELGLSGMEETLLARLRDEATYAPLFAEAFPRESDPVTLENITKALGAFQRSLISSDSPYDRYTRGEDTTMSESAIRGLELFFTETVECFHCHGAFNFSSSLTHEGTVLSEMIFENNGLYNVDSRGAYPEPNTGLFAFTGDRRDMGRMRPPTLRNIALTAPYMHDGSIATLEDVVAHYEAGGRNIESGDNAGDGRLNPNKSGFVGGFTLSEQQRQDLIAFLESLTDETFVTDPRHADPWAP